MLSLEGPVGRKVSHLGDTKAPRQPAVNGSLDMTQTALERANAAAAGIALQVGAAEAAETQALAALREAS